jgi:hypothetical protein
MSSFLKFLFCLLLSLLNLHIISNSICFVLNKSESRLHLDKFQAVALLAKEGCKEICKVMDGAIRNNVKQMFENMEA